MGHYFFGIIGCILLIAACWLFARRSALLLKGVTAVGTIESFRKSELDGSVHFLPVIIFQDQEGKTYRFTATTGYGANKPAEGLRVRVRYSRENPGHAVIISFLHLWVAPLVLIAFGAGCIATAFGVIPITIRLF